MMKVIVLTTFHAFLFFNHKWHLRSGWGGEGGKEKAMGGKFRLLCSNS